MTEKAKRFGFLLTDQSSMICFSSAIEPLRSANRMSGRHLYDWNILTVDGLSVQTSNGISILPDMALGCRLSGYPVCMRWDRDGQDQG